MIRLALWASQQPRFGVIVPLRGSGAGHILRVSAKPIDAVSMLLVLQSGKVTARVAVICFHFGVIITCDFVRGCALDAIYRLTLRTKGVDLGCGDQNSGGDVVRPT